MPSSSSSSEPVPRRAVAPTSLSQDERAVSDTHFSPPIGIRVAPPVAAFAWFAPFTLGVVWVRAARIALPVGLLQAGINQGDYWLRGEFTAAVITKTLLTPIVTLAVALLAAASTCRLIPPSARPPGRPARRP